MTLSYFVNQESVNVPRAINNYWTRKFDDEHVLITTEHGSWVVLDKREFDLLRTGNLIQDLNLFTNLEDKGIIITEKNFDRIASMYSKRFFPHFRGTNLHIITPTLRCNQNCHYCYPDAVSAGKKGFDMDRETAKDIVDFVFQSPSPSITIEFQGGEPLMNFPIVEYIVEYAKKKNASKNCDEWGWWKGEKDLAFQIVSNLTVMDDDMLDFMIKNNVRINTSLDGPKKIHDKNRPYNNGSSYSKVSYWIDKIWNEMQYKFFGAQPTITKFSLSHSKEIIDEYLKFNLNNINLRPVFISGRAIKMWNRIGFTSEEFFDFWKNSLTYILNLNKKGINFVEGSTAIILNRIVTLEPSNYTCLGMPCGACTIQAGYNQWGDVFTCDEARDDSLFKLGNVKEDNYKKIFTSQAALDFVGLTFSSQEGTWLRPYTSPCLVCTYGKQKNLVSKLPEDYIYKIHCMQIEHIFKKLIFSEDDRKIMFKWLS